MQIVAGVPVKLVRRAYRLTHRYTVFTWARACVNGSWVVLGKPWQDCSPTREEIKQRLGATK